MSSFATLFDNNTYLSCLYNPEGFPSWQNGNNLNTECCHTPHQYPCSVFLILLKETWAKSSVSSRNKMYTFGCKSHCVASYKQSVHVEEPRQKIDSLGCHGDTLHDPKSMGTAFKNNIQLPCEFLPRGTKGRSCSYKCKTKLNPTRWRSPFFPS